MNKKMMIIAGIVLILVGGIASAGIVSWLSNSISANVEVKGPVFYANSEKINLFGEEVRKLSINSFYESTSSYLIRNGDSETFWTNPFENPLDFYKPVMNLSVRSKIQEGTVPKDLKLVFGYYEGDNMKDICFGKVTIESNTSYSVYSTICASYNEENLPIKNLDGFYYKIEGTGTPNVETKVSLTDQKTKAEIIGVAE